MKNLIVLLLSLFMGSVAVAQQNVPMANGIPVAPQLPIPPIPSESKVYQTAEGMDIRVTVVAKLANPYSIVFLPDNVMLVTEKDGRLRVIRNGVLDPVPADGVP